MGAVAVSSVSSAVLRLGLSNGRDINGVRKMPKYFWVFTSEYAVQIQSEIGKWNVGTLTDRRRELEKVLKKRNVNMFCARNKVEREKAREIGKKIEKCLKI